MRNYGKIEILFTDGTSIIADPPCDPPNHDIHELLQEEYKSKYYGFVWIEDEIV